MAPRAPRKAPGSNAGRVIAGSARGARLVGAGEGTRPLSDRVKQALFAILEPSIRGAAFLDLFAGSGAGGVEALSRGASRAVFVDWDRTAVEAIKRNLEATGLAGPAALIERTSALAWLAREGGLAQARLPGAAGPFGAILIDPPYDASSWLPQVLGDIADAGAGAILAADGVAVVKHFWKVELPAGIGLLRSIRAERFGETMLTFYRWADEDAS